MDCGFEFIEICTTLLPSHGPLSVANDGILVLYIIFWACLYEERVMGVASFHVFACAICISIQWIFMKFSIVNLPNHN